MISKLMIHRFFIIMCISVLHTNSGSETNLGTRRSCWDLLRWVPYITKRPYLSFMNSAFCPTWQTRHSFTKLRTVETHITVPSGMPMAIMCGVCYTPTRIERNVTITENWGDGKSRYLETFPVENRHGKTEHSLRGHACQVHYVLTTPMAGHGELVCAAQFGKRIVEEILFYSVEYTPKLETEQFVTVPHTEESVTLSCPGYNYRIQTHNPIVHVWENLLTENKFAAATTNPNVTFAVGKVPLLLSCTTYHLFGSEIVLVRKFEVSRYVSQKFAESVPLSSIKELENPLVYGKSKAVVAQRNGAESEQLNLIVLAVLLSSGFFLTILHFC